MGVKREQIGARLRFAVLRRCNFACYYCGIPAAFGVRPLHIDHVVPVDLGGTNDPWNLVAACWDCNLGKTNTAPDAALIARVCDDYLATLPFGEAGRTIICATCRLPYRLPEGDEAYTHCMPCVDRELAIFELGYQRGSDVA